MRHNTSYISSIYHLYIIYMRHNTSYISSLYHLDIIYKRHTTDLIYHLYIISISYIWDTTHLIYHLYHIYETKHILYIMYIWDTTHNIYNLYHINTWDKSLKCLSFSHSFRLSVCLSVFLSDKPCPLTGLGWVTKTTPHGWVCVCVCIHQYTFALCEWVSVHVFLCDLISRSSAVCLWVLTRI